MDRGLLPLLLPHLSTFPIGPSHPCSVNQGAKTSNGLAPHRRGTLPKSITELYHRRPQPGSISHVRYLTLVIACFAYVQSCVQRNPASESCRYSVSAPVGPAPEPAGSLKPAPPYPRRSRHGLDRATASPRNYDNYAPDTMHARDGRKDPSPFGSA